MGYSHFRIGKGVEKRRDTYMDQSEAECRSSCVTFRKGQISLAV